MSKKKIETQNCPIKEVAAETGSMSSSITANVFLTPLKVSKKICRRMSLASLYSNSNHGHNSLTKSSSESFSESVSSSYKNSSNNSGSRSNSSPDLMGTSLQPLEHSQRSFHKKFIKRDSSRKLSEPDITTLHDLAKRSKVVTREDMIEFNMKRFNSTSLSEKKSNE
ncbi:hypothetical protein ACO0SA_000804 [Hanseniaspora valbyensis]